MKQLLQIGARGELSSLRFPPDKGLDLRELGKASDVRSSEIELHTPSQRYIIRFLHLPDTRPWWERLLCERESTYLDMARWLEVFNARPEYEFDMMDSLSLVRDGGRCDVFGFDTYENAVKAEVVFIQQHRLVHGPDSI